MESKNQNKLKNIRKQKETHRYREQSVVTRGERGRKRKIGEQEVRTVTCKVREPRGHTAQHSEHSQHFTAILKGVETKKMLNHYGAHAKII